MRHWLWGCLALATLLVAGRSTASDLSFRIVVNAENSIETIGIDTLRNIFLKKHTRWPSGGVIRVVDQHPSRKVRQIFSAEVLNRSVQLVKTYWQQRIFSGRDLPPPELLDDEEVTNYVAKHEDGIGYVSVDAALPPNVRAIEIR